MNLGEILYTVILYPLVQIIEIAFMLFDKLFDNTGIAIMGVSFVVTILCLPLYIVAERWQQLERDTQARLKGGVDRIKAVFKGDEQYMILSTYYRQNHYHPMMALRSSFGLLIQVPFFMAAYSCLSSLPALQGESFLFIRNMGEPDALFSIGSFTVNILPIAMTAINIVAGAIYTKGFPFKEKAQIYGMALLFLVLLYNSPAGLVLYWTMNNVFSLVKNIFYKLKHPVWVLYILMCVGIVFAGVFVLFIYDGGASMTKRLAAVIPMACLMLTPLVLKATEWLLAHPLASLMADGKTRRWLFLFSAGALAVLAGLVLPSSLIASSVQEFSNIGEYGNPRAFLADSFWQAIGLFVFWPACIFFLFREKIQSLLATSFTVGLAWALLNAFVFTGNYGSMDVTLKFPDGFSNPSMGYMLVNLIVLGIAAIVMILLLRWKKQKLLSSVCLIATISFIAFGFININTINRDYTSFQEGAGANAGDTMEIEPVFHLSKTGKNVVVLMLDRAESAYFEYILADQPEIKDAFTGFTYYKNTLGYNSHTLIGAPPLYGGYEYTPFAFNSRPEIKLKDKHNEALLLMPRILTEEVGFTATLSDSSWGNYSYIADMRFTDGYEKIEGIKIQGRYTGQFKKEFPSTASSVSLEDGLKRNLLWVSIFREVPVIARSVVYYKGSYLQGESAMDTDTLLDSYSALAYLLELTDFSSQADSFLMITNETTHSNEDISSFNLVDINSLSYPVAAGYYNNTISLLALARWFNYLKENGVYDNTRIIIVSDHGMGYGEKAAEGYDDVSLVNNNKDNFHPILLYKDFDASGGIETDMSFMTVADVPTLALEGVVENPTNPFTGNPINSDAKADGVYISTDDIFMPHHGKSDYVFTVKEDLWYHVKDNIFIDSNWTQEVPQ
ncbi:MAG: YidC/Oxa1 family membrane protein insertase [Treponema sp.]|nr:YidC/Oxa1 family membrane protein insertase [Treponema sp.]